jgi:hypothetical protein
MCSGWRQVTLSAALFIPTATQEADCILAHRATRCWRNQLHARCKWRWKRSQAPPWQLQASPSTAASGDAQSRHGTPAHHTLRLPCFHTLVATAANCARPLCSCNCLPHAHAAAAARMRKRQCSLVPLLPMLCARALADLTQVVHACCPANAGCVWPPACLRCQLPSVCQVTVIGCCRHAAPQRHAAAQRQGSSSLTA